METTLLEIEKSLFTGTYAKLKAEIIEELHLTDETIAGCKFEDCDFIDVVFENCDFQGSSFINVHFENCQFINCNFHFSKFENCNWVECSILSCNFCIINSLKNNFLSCTYLNNTIEKVYSEFDKFVNCEMDENAQNYFAAIESTHLQCFRIAPHFPALAA